jgi:molecular chaperone DnaJ
MNFYELLNITKNANAEEIKKAFRAKALEYHPDKNPNDSEAEKKFKEINNAYEILSNQQKKEIYDQEAFGSYNGQSPWASQEDLFAELFGAASNNPFYPFQRNQKKQSKPQYDTTVTLNLSETLEKKHVILDINLKEICKFCHGTAVEKNAERCNKCGGTFNPLSPCNICNGSGVTYRSCKNCAGSSITNTIKKISATIPRGVISNTQLKIDTIDCTIIVTTNVIYPPDFKNNAAGKLIKEILIPYHIAILGGEFTIGLIENKTIKVKFPPMVEGQMIKIKGKGIYLGPMSQERGDLYLLPKIKIPKTISEKHKTIIEELAMICQSEENDKNE